MCWYTLAMKSDMRESTLTYDEALKRLEAIVAELEQAEALPMEQYKQRAEEAKALLACCQNHLQGLEEELLRVV